MFTITRTQLPELRGRQGSFNYVAESDGLSVASGGSRRELKKELGQIAFDITGLQKVHAGPHASTLTTLMHDKNSTEEAGSNGLVRKGKLVAKGTGWPLS
jgi:hypothetical protein